MKAFKTKGIMTLGQRTILCSYTVRKTCEISLYISTYVYNYGRWVLANIDVNFRYTVQL
jgi:hypothetical protein